MGRPSETQTPTRAGEAHPFGGGCASLLTPNAYLNWCDVTTEICLIDPKFPRNVGMIVRAAAIFDAHRILMTGDRVNPKSGPDTHRGTRLPREERFRGSRNVEIHRTGRPFDDSPHLTPVGIEVVSDAEILPWFDHPEDAMYVFGPEDGSLPRSVLGQCHRIVRIPGLHCANLAAAVYMTLYDREMKRVLAGHAPLGLEREDVFA